MAINPPSAEEVSRSAVAIEKVCAQSSDDTLKAADTPTPDVDEAQDKKAAQTKRSRSSNKKE